MRRAGDVCFSQFFNDDAGTNGIVDYISYDDKKNAITKLDDSEFRNAFGCTYVRLKEYKGSTSKSCSRSPARGRSYSRSRSKSPSRRHSRGSETVKFVDMVGHTRDIEAIVVACKAADEAVKIMIDAIEQVGGIYIITADHGNDEDKVNVNLVIELCAGVEFFDRIIAKGHYSEKVAASILRQIVNVVHVCHFMGELHRNVKTPDVHMFLQHLITFGIVRKYDLSLYRKLVVGSAWRKQMPKLGVSLGLGDEMSDMIEELISRGQQVDAVHFTHEVGLVDKFPTVHLLKAFLKDTKKVAATITKDPNNTGRSTYLAIRKEQSVLKAVIKCIEEYKLKAQFLREEVG
ncbi:hypothetical protein Droror1_Dr00008763 [Drosera rotundifolia]